MMFLIMAVLLAAAAAEYQPLTSDYACEDYIDKWVKPNFCNGLRCPPYKIVACGKGYEKRCYKASKWAVTASDKLDSKAFSPMFRRLFAYIRGANERSQKIKMTAPVSVAMHYNITDHKTKSEMAFYVPLKSPPKPTNAKVFLFKARAGCAYVRSFGGWVMSRSFYMYIQLGLLTRALEKDQVSYHKGESAYAGYDSPWKFFGRHNEVWRFPMKEEEEGEWLDNE